MELQLDFVSRLISFSGVFGAVTVDVVGSSCSFLSFSTFFLNLIKGLDEILLADFISFMILTLLFSIGTKSTISSGFLETVFVHCFLTLPLNGVFNASTICLFFLSGHLFGVRFNTFLRLVTRYGLNMANFKPNLIQLC